MLREDQVFIYEPLHKVKLFYAGGIIAIDDLNKSTELKRMLIFLLIAILAGSIYLLSSYVTNQIIKPTGKLAGVFEAIAAGDLTKNFEYKHNNELGMLAKATESMVLGLKERRLLGKFVSPTFDGEVTRMSARQLASELDGVILFSDIRNFTTISESHSPEFIAALLNQHLKEMVDIIKVNGGEIEQFIGDAIVAFFPGSAAISCHASIKAARLMMKKHAEIQNIRKAQGLTTYRIGNGLEFGRVMGGTLTSGKRCEFSIIGPARAEAERLEALSKNAGYTRIIVGQNLARHLTGTDFVLVAHESDSYELKYLESGSQ
jgi:adenylate cyclase